MSITTQVVFKSNSNYIRETFGERVQKISINTGNSCPNRDGTKGIGGCTYCNINSIRPGYAFSKKSVTTQIKEGIVFFSHKNNTQKYLVYFQSYTNTFGNIKELISDYQEALQYPGVVGLVIATRPDCLPTEVVEYLNALSEKTYISVELGIESTKEETLLKINRCHTYTETIYAFNLLSNKKINLGGHIIIGFPWESKEDILNHAKRISQLPIKLLKIHHLQILKNTQLAKEYETVNYKLLTVEEHLDLVIEFIEHLRPDIVVQRFIAESPRNVLIAPQWNGIRNRDFTTMVENKMRELGTWQGKKHIENSI